MHPDVLFSDRNLGRYTISTPIDYIDALRFQSSSIGLRPDERILPLHGRCSVWIFCSQAPKYLKALFES